MTAGELFVKMALDQKPYDKGLAEAERKAKSAGTSIGNALRQSLKLPMLSIGALIASIGTAAVKAGIDTQEALKIVQTGLGVVGKDLEAYKNIWKSVNREVPQSGAEVANVLVDLRKRIGVTGGALQYLTKMTMDYARVNREDAAESTRALTRLMNSLYLDASTMPDIMDKLTYASQRTGIGVNRLADLVTEAGPAFGEMGFGLNKSIALFSEFEKAGANPSEIISSLSIVLNNLSKKGIRNTEEAFSNLLREIKEAPTLLDGITIAIESFGSRVGSKIADDIRAGRFEVEEFAAALDQAAGTLDRVAVESLTFTERLAIMWKEVTMSLEPLGSLLLDLAQGVFPFFADMLSLITVLLQSFVSGLRWGQEILGKYGELFKTLLVTLGSYIVLTKLAIIATDLFKLSKAALQGTLATNIPLLGTLSQAVAIYKAQMMVAPVATNFFTASLYKLQAAAYAAYTALGPVGWIIIAISAALGVGISLWGKYKQSLVKAVKAPQIPKLSGGQEALSDSTDKANKNLGKQTKALKKLAKEAAKTLTSIDELHKIEKAIAGADGGAGGAGAIPSFGGFDGFDLGDVFDPEEWQKALDEALQDMDAEPSIWGFIKWLHHEVEKGIKWIVDLIPESFWKWLAGTDFGQWLIDVLAPALEEWGLDLDTGFWDLDAFWEKLKEEFKKGWDDFILWIKNLGTTDLDGIWSLKNVWTNFKTWAADWKWMKQFSTWLDKYGSDETDNKWSLKNIWTAYLGWIGSWSWVKEFSTWLRNFGVDETTNKWSLKKIWTSFWTWLTSWLWIAQFIQWILDFGKDETTGKWSLKNIWTNFWTWIASWPWISNFIQWFKDFGISETTGKWDLKKVWTSFFNWVSSWSWVQSFRTWLSNLGRDETKEKWSLKNIWTNWKDWIKTWTWVDKLRDWLRDVFAGVTVKFPKIRTPKFSVTWSTAGTWGKIGEVLGLPGKPNIKVQWLAEGGMYSRPTLLGMGEAGREVAIPLDRNTEWADILVDKLVGALPGTNKEAGQTIIQVILNGNTILEEIIDESKRKNARAGKTVVQLGVS